jgi:serine protease Do
LPGDVILAIDGVPIASPLVLRYRIAMRKPGDTVRLAAVKGGKRYEIPVTVVAPPAVPERDDTKLTALSPWRGARLASLSPALAEEIGADSGIAGVVVLGVGPMSAAARRGLRAGDIIRNLDGRTITTVAELKAFRVTPFKPWRMTVTRAGASVVINQSSFSGLLR